MEIKGVQIQKGEPLYAEGPYGVYIGYIETDTNRDIPHYLIINIKTQVVEGSTARLFEARGICQAYAKELEMQDEALSKNMDIVEPNDPDGNVDPSFKRPKKREWKN